MNILYDSYVINSDYISTLQVHIQGHTILICLKLKQLTQIQKRIVVVKLVRESNKIDTICV